MIEFEVVNSPDQDIIGPHIYHKDNMTVGRSLQNDLIILDPQIALHHIEIKIGKQVLVSSISSLPFLISNKKVINEINYKLGEEIKIGTTILKINKHISIVQENKNIIFENNYQMIESEKPAIIEVLENIETELKIVERDRYVD
ncbi:MAG: FHA domain-containing protein [Bacteriovoracaceae bacterium]